MSSVIMKQYDGKFKKGSPRSIVAQNFLDAAKAVWNFFNDPTHPENITNLVDVVGLQLTKDNVVVNMPEGQVSITMNIKDNTGGIIDPDIINRYGLFAGPQITETESGSSVILAAHTNADGIAALITLTGFYDVTNPANPVLITPSAVTTGSWQAIIEPSADSGSTLTQKTYEARFDITSIPAAPVPVSGISTSAIPADITTPAGTTQITAAVAPVSASNQNIRYSVSDPAVATVSATGLVTAIADGVVAVAASTEDGGFTAVFTVTVSNQ